MSDETRRRVAEMGGTVSDERHAIVDRREQISQEPRPKPIYGKAEVEVETADVWRVYHREWITVFRSQNHGRLARSEIDHFYAVKYKGRVKESEVRVIPTSQKNPEEWPWLLQLKLPNLMGEFKHEDDAVAYIGNVLDGVAELVRRNSKPDHRLRNYGKNMLLENS